MVVSSLVRPGYIPNDVRLLFIDILTLKLKAFIFNYNSYENVIKQVIEVLSVLPLGGHSYPPPLPLGSANGTEIHKDEYFIS